jgi:hypothetical protein
MNFLRRNGRSIFLVYFVFLVLGGIAAGQAF